MVPGARIYQKTIELMDTVVWGKHTAGYLLAMTGIAAASLMIVQFVISLAYRKGENPPPVRKAACLSCGWKGNIVLHAGRCPQCHQPFGDRQATIRDS